MKKSTLILILFFPIFAVSQDLIAVQNGNTPSFYTDLSEAIQNAAAGDTLYIPGKNYIINDTIRKPLHLVGVGHDPNSTNATSRTVFTTSNWDIPQIVLDSGADNGSMTGISFTPISTPYQRRTVRSLVDINNYSIDRCLVSLTVIMSNSIIKESIIERSSIIANNSTLITNNIFTNRSNSFNNCSIRNNNFLLGVNNYECLSAHNCIIENNILPPNFAFNNLSNNSIRNNLNGEFNGISGTNVYSGNFDVDINLDMVFISYTQLSDAFNYIADFHLPDNSPYKNSGTDGKDIGIYGGRFPWKDGSIPFNPHIVSKDISGNTDENGNLLIQIEVKAQEN